MLHTGVCTNVALLTYLQQREFQWRHVALRHRIELQLHDFFVLVTLERISLHYITLKISTTVTEIYFRDSSFVWMPPSCVVGHSISRRVCFARSRRSAKSAFYRRGKLVVSELFTMKTRPVSVTWTMGFNNETHYYSSLQLACSFKTHAKHTKTHEKYKLVISAAVLSAATKLRWLALCGNL